MRQKLLQFLFVIAAIITAIPIANADVTISEPTLVWKTELAPASDAIMAAHSDIYGQGAASDGIIFTLPGSSTVSNYPSNMTQGYLFGKDLQSIWSGGNLASAFPYETSGSYYYLGPCIASDDAGTLWCASRRSASPVHDGTYALVPWAVGARALTYYTERPAKGVAGKRYGIDLRTPSLHTSGRADIMSVYGDGVNGTGYFWFNIGSTTTIECIMIKNASTTNGKKMTFIAPIASSTNRGYVKQFAAKRVLFNAGKSGTGTSTLYVGTLNASTPEESTSITWESTGLTVCRHGSTAFMLAGHEMIAYSKSTTQIALYDNTDEKEIGTITPFSTVSNISAVSHSLDAKKVDDNNVDLYVYVPGQGGAKYTITATPITSPVSNLTVANVSGSTNSIIVSWGKPSQGTATKYAISYSSDGGSTWSTAVETTDLSYTFTDLTTGTYKFKVTPYFGGSSTWGPESIAPESIEVITAVGAPISNLAYSYLKNTETNIGRQDITLTWDAPTGMINTTVTGYKVYRNGSLLTTLGAEETEYTNTGLKQNYTYKVVPMFDGLAEDASFGLEVTTTEVQAGVLVAPVFTEIRNYEGYSLVEIFYGLPSYAPYKPLYYNLYRDGALIQGKLQSFNTLDESIVINTTGTTTVKYQIEAVYGSATDTYPEIGSVMSEVNTVEIAPRDIAKTRYILQEVYNVPINEITGTVPSDFSKVDYYRQGQFNTADKKWYIAQRGNSTDNVAGVITFDAENKDDVIKGSTQYFTNDVNENVGIAMDDKGTILLKNNNSTSLAATYPTTTSINSHAETGRTVYGSPSWGELADSYERRITSAILIAKDGTTKEVDLTKLWSTNGFVNDMYFDLASAYIQSDGSVNYAADYGQTRGRSDYYHMWGDVMGSEGGYLILSPSWTRTAFKVKIANGAYVSHEIISFDRYDHPSGNYSLTPSTGTENYGFKLDGRDDVTVQIRSNGYYGVHDWNATGWHPIFTAESRINNAGGASVEAFGTNVTQEMIDKEGSPYEQADLGKCTGELFIITPQSMHSHNVGDFLISRATKTNATDLASEGTLMPSAPVAMKVQTDARSNSTATNANGNWFYAEEGTYSGPTSATDPCVDIYQYVPGTRFARYRLIPSDQFPPVLPILDITTGYNEGKTEITHFDGVARWSRPKGFGRSGGEVNAKVVSYLFNLLNDKNEVVASDEIAEIYNEDGTPVADDHVYEFDYTAKSNKEAKDIDIDFSRYTVSVQVKYQTNDQLYHYSEIAYAEDIHDYPAEAVQNLATFAFKQANQTIDEWVEKDGQWVVEQKQVDNYRVEINFDKPDCDEPVSYYTVKALVNNKTDMIDITNFHLHNGMEVVNGIEQAILDRDADGKVIPTSVIPGTYDFENSKAPYYHKEGDAFGVAGQSRQNSVLTWHFRVPAGSLSSGVATASNGEEIVITDEPDQWTFIVVAHYAAKNTYIDKDREANAIPGSLIETGVEVVGEDNVSSLEIYPIPASTEITIKSAETINSIVIYNEAGAEVMNLDGDNEMVTTVNIESLATGYYFVKVNNQAPVKIIKK